MSDTDADALETRLEEEPGVAKAREKGGKNAVQASKRRGLWETGVGVDTK